MSVRFVLSAALAALTFAAGCGSDDDEAADGTTAVTETADTTTDTSAPAGTALTGTVGPGFDISLTTADGQALGTPSGGRYELEVEDLSSIHNHRLTGPGVDVSTSAAGEGTESFTVELRPGSYTFVCDLTRAR
ncbi:MAG: hypothetical protein ACRDNY_05345 [Gaiellaceae bacterium]